MMVTKSQYFWLGWPITLSQSRDPCCLFLPNVSAFDLSLTFLALLALLSLRTHGNMQKKKSVGFLCLCLRLGFGHNSKTVASFDIPNNPLPLTLMLSAAVLLHFFVKKLLDSPTGYVAKMISNWYEDIIFLKSIQCDEYSLTISTW